MDMLATYLSDRDVACPNCAYNLRGLADNRCPECDQEVELGVHLTDPAAGALLATMAPLWTLGGGGVVFNVIVLLVSISYRDLPDVGVFVVPNIALVLGCTGAWLLGRQAGRIWFRSLAPGRRSMALAITWSLLVVLVVLFTVHLMVIM